MSLPRSGFTLPVFACGAAIAALRYLQQSVPAQSSETLVTVDLIEPPQLVSIPIEQVARLGERQALAITRSDPGDNLDLTRHTPVWALVELHPLSKQASSTATPQQRITLQGGEGIGKQSDRHNAPAIYRYAQTLLTQNLASELPPDEAITVTVILPEGRRLAQRTSNAAFGIVDGLALLGTTGIAQPLSAPEQLAQYQAVLSQKAQQFDTLVFCIGENGLALATRLGIPTEQQVKTANWLGSMLVTAGLVQLNKILLLGYHGKLLKLAGGIFHTHHFLADARLEILTAYSALAGLSQAQLQHLFAQTTAEAALTYLRSLDGPDHDLGSATDWVSQIYGAIATAIDQRAITYIQKHAEHSPQVGSILFDRQQNIIIHSQNGRRLLSRLC